LPVLTLRQGVSVSQPDYPLTPRKIGLKFDMNRPFRAILPPLPLNPARRIYSERIEPPFASPASASTSRRTEEEWDKNAAHVRSLLHCKRPVHPLPLPRPLSPSLSLPLRRPNFNDREAIMAGAKKRALFRSGGYKGNRAENNVTSGRHDKRA